jgi:Tetracyclin repressor-like, C-terminal domain
MRRTSPASVNARRTSYTAWWEHRGEPGETDSRPTLLSLVIRSAIAATPWLGIFAIFSYVETLVDQLTRIVAEGVAVSAFAADDPRAAARAAFDATSRLSNLNDPRQATADGIAAARIGERAGAAAPAAASTATASAPRRTARL